MEADSSRESSVISNLQDNSLILTSSIPPLYYILLLVPILGDNEELAI